LRVPEIKYFGTIITADGMKPDPAKVKAINDIPTPVDKADVKCLLGMINCLAIHIPNTYVYSNSTIERPPGD